MPFHEAKIIVYLALGLFFLSLITGCAGKDLPPLPSFAAPPAPAPAPEPAFVEASPKSRIGGVMEYGHDPLREYVIYAKWGGLTPISLTPGARIGGVSIANPEGWRIDDRQSYGSGRSATPILALSPGSGSRATTAVVTTQAADGLFMLRLVPHKTGFSQVKFRKQQQGSSSSRVLAQGPDKSRAGAPYRLRGDRVAWQPLNVRDDGTRTFVELRPGSEAFGVPAVMAIGEGKDTRPVNARKQGNTLVIDGIHPHGLRLSLGDETIEARRL